MGKVHVGPLAELLRIRLIGVEHRGESSSHRIKQKLRGKPEAHITHLGKT